MALWQHDTTGERWDDGLTKVPGDADFSRALALAHYGNPKFSYLGTPNAAAVEVIAGIPQEVTKRQALQALILAGLDDQLDAVLAGMQGQAGKLARAEWHESNTIQRNRPLVTQLGSVLGLSPAQIDQLFVTAASL